MKTILVAYSFGYNQRFGFSGIDRYSQGLDSGLVNIRYKHDTYAYGEYNSKIKGLASIKRLFSIPRAVKGYDIIHLTQPHGYEAFLNTKAKRILTWHDNMIFTRKNKAQFFNVFRGITAYELADIITFGSMQSFNELKEYVSKYKKFDKTKIYDITTHPIGDIWIKAKVNKKQERRGFIYIGAIDYPHKNFRGLLKTYTEICDNIGTQKPPLRIFTSSPNANEILQETAKAFGIHLNSYPIMLYERKSDKEILPILRQSIALLHLSFEEGYGLPIMESMAVGTPVITLDGAKIPEETKKWTISTQYPIGEALKLYEKPRSASQEAISYAKSLTKENYAKKMVKLYKGV